MLIKKKKKYFKISMKSLPLHALFCFKLQLIE